MPAANRASATQPIEPRRNGYHVCADLDAASAQHAASVLLVVSSSGKARMLVWQGPAQETGRWLTVRHCPFCGERLERAPW